MATAPHLLGRLDFRASVRDLDTALALRPRIEALAGRLMPRMLERVFDAFDPAGLHLRLDRLDLDLGTVRPDHLEQDTLAALEDALSEALAEAIHRARYTPSDDACLITPERMRLDQFETWLTTGLLPLANRGEPFDPVARLHQLADAQPGALIAMLRRRARGAHVLERLVVQLGEDGLNALLAVLAPADAAVILALLGDIVLAHRAEAIASLVTLAEPALTRILWIATLEFLLRDAGTQFNRRRFLAFLLGREGARAGIDYADLLKLLADAMALLKARAGFGSSLPVVLAELLAESAPPALGGEEESRPDSGDAAALVAARAGNFDALLALVRRRAGDRAALEALVRQLTAELFAGLIRRLEPVNADLILAVLDDLNAVHRAEALPVLPEAGFEQMLRWLTLRYLLYDAGSQFNRRRFLASLLEREAERAGVGYDALLRLFADAVERARVRTSFRSSLPMVLAELLAEQGPDPDAPAGLMAAAGEQEESAFAAARGGDFDGLFALFRDRAADRTAVEALLRKLDTNLFASLLRRLKPGAATALLAILDALAALHRGGLHPLLSEAGFEQLIRWLALRDLLRDPGHRFSHRSWLKRLIEDLAEELDMSDASMRRALAQALPPQATDATGLAAALAPEPAADLAAERIEPLADETGAEALARALATGEGADVAVLLRRAAGEPVLLLRIAAAIREDGRRRLLVALDPVNAEIVDQDLRAFARLHAVVPLLSLDGARFGQLLWALAVAWLAGLRGARFDRRALGRHLIAALASHGGVAPGEVAADLRRGLRRVAPNDTAASVESHALLDALSRERLGLSDVEAPEADRRRRIEHFLRTGQPPNAGQGLPALAGGDPAWLAATIRRLARDRPGALPALLERLLDWLLPEELLECLAPGKTARALRWADGVDGGARATWQPLFAVLVRDETPRFRTVPGGAGRRLDRLALIAHWLDHGSAAWWLPRGRPPTDLLADLANLTLAELTWLLGGASSERTLERLWRAMEPLDPARREGLLQRIAPWASSAAGPLKSVLAGLNEQRRLEVLLRAAAAALQGSALDLADLTRPVPAPPLPVVPQPPAAPAIDRARLFAWLDGADAGGVEAAALARYFARLADAVDPALIDHIGARRLRSDARARWAAILPFEVLGRLVHLMAPGGARALLDAAMLLASAWRQTASFGARRVEPALWMMLLDLVAEPRAVDLPAAIERLVSDLTNDEADQAGRLRTVALRLAQDGGYVSVTAALRRVPRPPTPVPAKAPTPATRKVANHIAKEEEPVPSEPEHAVYIGNAGLVLLNPYLPALFDQLGLLTREGEGPPRIVGLEATSRAVHLLQYLVDKRLDRPEPELVLNKLLCGIPTARPIESRIEPVQAELDICESLLRGVIANWPIIRNTSPEGLRETFLQREGRLLRGDSRWSLVVQRKGLDVLVDQIPWSLSLVYHRWMTDPIHVTW